MHKEKAHAEAPKPRANSAKQREGKEPLGDDDDDVDLDELEDILGSPNLMDSAELIMKDAENVLDQFFSSQNGMCCSFAPKLDYIWHLMFNPHLIQFQLF